MSAWVTRNGSAGRGRRKRSREIHSLSVREKTYVRLITDKHVRFDHLYSEDREHSSRRRSSGLDARRCGRRYCSSRGRYVALLRRADLQSTLSNMIQSENMNKDTSLLLSSALSPTKKTHPSCSAERDVKPPGVSTSLPRQNTAISNS